MKILIQSFLLSCFLVGSGSVCASFSEEVAHHTLRAYNLVDDDAAVRRFISHREYQEEKLLFKQQESRPSLGIFEAFLWRENPLFEDQKYQEERLWGLVSRMHYSLLRAKTGRGLDKEVFELRGLVKDYIERFEYQDTVLTGLAFEFLLQLYPFIVRAEKIHMEEQQRHRTIEKEHDEESAQQQILSEKQKKDQYLDVDIERRSLVINRTQPWSSQSYFIIKE